MSIINQQISDINKNISVINKKLESISINNSDNHLSEFQDGLNDEWLTYGGNNNNTRFINSNIIRSSNIFSIAVQKKSSKLPIKVSRQTYHPVFDNTHLYSVIIGDNSQVAVGISLDGDNAVLTKINRISGNVVISRSYTDIFGTLEPNKNLIGGRSPPELNGNYVYISTSGAGPGYLMAIAKLNKNDLSTVWTKQIKDVKSEPNYYTSRNICVINPTKGNYAGKTIILANYTVTAQYGNTISISNYILNYEWFLNQGGVFCYIDNGSSVNQLWEIKFGPKMLKKGDTVQANSFPPNKTSMKIIYPIVYVKGSNKNGLYLPNNIYDSSNITRSDGVKGFKIDSSTAGNLTFDLLTDDLKNVKKANIPFILNVGDVIWNDPNTFYTGTDGTKIPGSHIFTGQAVYKTINLGHIIQDEFEALNLNYFGVGSYGQMVYDDITGLVYIPTSNGQKQPYQDGLDIGQDNTLQKTATNYELSLQTFIDAALSGIDTNIKNSLINFNNVYQKYLDALSIRKSTKRSQRSSRFLASGLIAVDLVSGLIKWFDSTSMYDPFTWSQDNSPATLSAIMGDNGDNVVGATIINSISNGVDSSGNPIKVRRLITSDKAAYHTTINPDADISKAISGDSTNNYENGCTFNLPSNLIINQTPVGISGPQGGSFWGAASNGKVYISHQVNIPFGSSILRSKYFNINEQSLAGLKEFAVSGNPTAIIGYISNNVVQNNDSTIYQITNNIDNTTSYLIPSQTGYLVATDCLTGNIKWICPLSSTLEASAPSADIFRSVPVVTDGSPVSIVNDIAIVGMASGKIHFVNVNTGDLIKTIGFAEGAASGVCVSRDTIYFQGGWRKWLSSNAPMTDNMKFLTLHGQ